MRGCPGDSERVAITVVRGAAIGDWSAPATKASAAALARAAPSKATAIAAESQAGCAGAGAASDEDEEPLRAEVDVELASTTTDEHSSLIDLTKSSPVEELILVSPFDFSFSTAAGGI